MKIHREIGDLKFVNPVLTTGTFDGVHTGHLAIIKRLKQVAAKKQGETVVFTFWPHPRFVVYPDEKDLKLLNTLDEKIELLEKAGIDNLIIYPFTIEFSKLDSYNFIKNLLVEKIGVRHLVFGYDHQFGRNREGKFDRLKECADTFGFGIEKVEACEMDNKNISSTLIRKSIIKGNVAEAAKYLGYDYPLTGTIEEGDKIGRKIGFPTANIHIGEGYKLIPPEGVYAVKVKVEDTVYNGMLNIGTPTVGQERKKSIEVHILDFEEWIYNKKIAIFFKHRIRDEMKFATLDELTMQLYKDRSHVTNMLR